MTASGCDTDFKNEREKQMKKAISILLFAALPFLVFSKDENLPHKTNDKNAPVVYFTRDVTSSGLMKVYNALNQRVSGKVGIKVSFGAPDEEVLNPELLRDLVSRGGPDGDCCGGCRHERCGSEYGGGRCSSKDDKATDRQITVENAGK